MEERTRLLICLAAATAVNCLPCFEYYFGKAKTVGLSTEEIRVDIMEFSHPEIADILGITVENVKVRLHRARKRLKAILEEKCAFERDERNVLICTPVRSAETALFGGQSPSFRGTSLMKTELKGKRPSKQ